MREVQYCKLVRKQIGTVCGYCTTVVFLTERLSIRENSTGDPSLETLPNRKGNDICYGIQGYKREDRAIVCQKGTRLGKTD